jgi:hypothetical protein
MLHPQFRLRSLFILTAVVAVLAWCSPGAFVERIEEASQQDFAKLVFGVVFGYCFLFWLVFVRDWRPTNRPKSGNDAQDPATG